MDGAGLEDGEIEVITTEVGMESAAGAQPAEKHAATVIESQRICIRRGLQVFNRTTK